MAILNRKVDYALLILCYLHHQPEGGAARAIAAHFNLSRAFVANILKDLCHKGFVISQRGVKGGYVLRQPADKTTLADLLDALDDTVRLAECNRERPEECCSLAPVCPVRAPIAVVHSRIRDVLETVTLAEIFGQSETQLAQVDCSRCELEPRTS
jgi:Rrf2 family cysteine metabolism transcriptional repressor